MRKVSQLLLIIFLYGFTAFHVWLASTMKQLMFDEKFYIGLACKLMAGSPDPYTEEPPLGKLLLAIGPLIGDNFVLWRLVPICFGIIGLVAFYNLIRTSENPVVAMVVTILLGINPMWSAMSNLAMLDIIYTSLMLVSFCFVFKRKTLAPVMAGISALAKISGLTTVMIVWLYNIWKGTKREIAQATIIPVAVFVTGLALLPVFEGMGMANPLSAMRDMIAKLFAFTCQTATNNLTSLPYMWLIKPYHIYATDHLDITVGAIYILGIPLILYALYLALVRKLESGCFILCWLVGSLGVWIALALITQRAMYVYYMLPVIPAYYWLLSIGMRELWNQTWKQKT